MAINLGRIGMNPRGEWDEETIDYVFLDFVTYLQSSYVVIHKGSSVPAGTLPTNEDFFMLQAKRGDDGDVTLDETGRVNIDKLTNNNYSISIITDAVLTYGKDGIIAFENDGKFYLVGGWNGSETPKTDNEQWVSEDLGNTWAKIADAPFTGRHTVATETANGKTYIVGGDLYNLEYDGSYSKQSWSFDDGSWTKIAEDSGIGNRILSELVYHGGSFYLIGGQTSANPIDGLYTTVLKSVNNCASFSSIGTTPFAGGNLWGAVVSFNGKMWKVCGGVYSDELSERTYPREIYSSTDGVTWVNEGLFPGVGRSYAQLTVLGDEMILSHGYNHLEGGNLNDFWRSDDGIIWTEIKINDITRHAHAAWVYDDVLYWAGGTTNDSEAQLVKDVVSFKKAETIEDFINNSQSTSTDDVPNTLVKRTKSGDIIAKYIKTTNQVSIGATPNSITGKLTDGYLYQFSQEALRTFLGYSDLALSASFNDMVNKPTIDKILEIGNETTRRMKIGEIIIGLGGFYESGVSGIWFDNIYGLQIMPGGQQATGSGLPTRLFNAQFLRPDGGVLWENKTGTNRTDFMQLGVIDVGTGNNIAPSSATAAGSKGEIRITTDYIYVCVATNTWKRTSLDTW